MTTPLEAPIPHNQDFASEEHLFQHLEAYPWATDGEFQTGLASILGSRPHADAQKGPEQDDLILQAKCFYYSRKTNKPIDFQAYKSWIRSRHVPGHPPPIPVPEIASIDAIVDSPTPASSADIPFTPQLALPATSPPPADSDASASTPPDGPYPTSFAQIVELIESGKPIPGIEEIPDTVLAGQEAPSKENKRMKPWEKKTSEPDGLAVGDRGAD